MDILSLVFAALLASQAGSAQPTDTDYTRAVIIDTGSPSTAQTEAPPTDDYTRAVIIDTGGK